MTTDDVVKPATFASVDEMLHALDALLIIHDRKVCREIDAGACGTRRDFQAAHDAAEKFENAKAVFVMMLLGSVKL